VICSPPNPRERVLSSVDGWVLGLVLIAGVVVVLLAIGAHLRAKARTTTAAAPQAPRIVPSGSRLARLKDMRDQGLITQEEHDKLRREVLRDL
jgi:hypothetical protein